MGPNSMSKKTLLESYHDMPSDCRELAVPNVYLNHPRRGVHLTFLFLHPMSSLQQQPAVQASPYTEAYLHVSDDRLSPAAQV